VDLAGLLARASQSGGPAEDAALEGAAVLLALAGARHSWRAWAGAPAALGLLAALTRAAVAAGGCEAERAADVPGEALKLALEAWGRLLGGGPVGGAVREAAFAAFGAVLAGAARAAEAEAFADAADDAAGAAAAERERVGQVGLHSRGGTPS